jgi:hypothetical protein
VDPRVHFALVGATKGAPTLMPRAFSAESLDAQLDFAARNALANPRHLRWNDERGILMGTSMLQWNAADFGGPPGVIAFVKRYAPAATQELIESKKVLWVSGFLPFDWTFNEPPPNAEPASEKTSKPPQDSKKGGS